jgi:hypothetical protein
MGVQGNYPGSGEIGQHKHLAMRGSVPGGGNNMDSHLNEGGPEPGMVDDPNMPAGKGGGSYPEPVSHRAGNVRAVNPSE